MIKLEKQAQFGEYGNDARGILFTEVNYNDAQDYFDYLDNECTDKYAVHFICDSKQIIEVMPVEFKVYCTGKGKDWAYKHCLIVGLCKSNDDVVFDETIEKAVNVAKELIDAFDITKNDIFFVSEFNSKRYDPSTILDLYGTKQFFIEKEFNL